MRIAPNAEIDDGLLDVVLIGEHPKRSFLVTLPKVFRGAHVNHPAVRVLRGRELRVDADRRLARLRRRRPDRHHAGHDTRRPERAAGAGPGVMLAAKIAVARAAGALSRRSGRGATSLPGKLLMRMEPDAIAAPRPAAARRQRRDLGDERQDDDGRDGRRDPRALGRPPRAQPRRREHGRRRRERAARRRARRRHRRRRRALRGRRVLARQRRPRADGRARCCWRTCFAISSTATASWRRSPTAGPRPSPPPRRRSSCSTPTIRSSRTSAAARRIA